MVCCARAVQYRSHAVNMCIKSIQIRVMLIDPTATNMLYIVQII